MRTQLTAADARLLGSQIKGFSQTFSSSGDTPGFSHSLAHKVEESFHRLSPEEQRYQFSAPLWELVQDHIRKITHTPMKPLEKIPGMTYPIVPGFKEAMDLILKIIFDGNDVLVSEIDVNKGGLASNVVEALSLHGMPAYIPSLHGNPNNVISTTHQALMESCGIDTSMLIHTRANSYLHTSFYVIDGDEKDYWMAQYRDPFHKDELDKFTDLIKQCCMENKGEVLVLSALPPAGTDDHYFPELASLGNPTFLNPKQYDYFDFEKGSFLTHLLKQRRLALIKPNLDEFVQLLKFGYHISANDAPGLYETLKRETDNDEFSTLIDKGQKLLKDLNETGILLISLGKKGAVILNRDYWVYSRAPIIDSEEGCPSGAGDSGLAALIVEAKKSNVDFTKHLNDADLKGLLHPFVKVAGATASLAGNLIAGPETVDAIMQQQEHDLWTISRKFRH
jgi:fructose-1-phosphate kinase PfkB-like protein